MKKFEIKDIKNNIKIMYGTSTVGLFLFSLIKLIFKEM